MSNQIQSSQSQAYEIILKGKYSDILYFDIKLNEKDIRKIVLANGYPSKVIIKKYKGD